MKKGFTLLELLIVIGILAILATTVTIILNPAELLRQARDSQRLSDLQSLNTAVNLYASTVNQSPLFSGTSTQPQGTCTVASPSPNPFTGTCTDSASTKVDGTGWVTINFNSVSTGAPLSKLPVDPINSTAGATDYFYAFRATSTIWEINTVLESTKYAETENLDAKDGGSNDSFYEIGANLFL